MPPDEVFNGCPSKLFDLPIQSPEIPQAVPNPCDAGDTQTKGPSVRGVSTAAAPFLPPNLAKVQDQQPNVAAAPFIPTVSIKANATPFVPGFSSGKPKAGFSSPGHDIYLPSVVDFTLGLTDLSAVSRGDDASPMTLVTAPQNDINRSVRGNHPYHMQHAPTASTKVGGGNNLSLHIRRERIYSHGPSGMSGETLMSARFASEQLHAELKHKAFLEQAQMDPASEGATDLPRVCLCALAPISVIPFPLPRCA